MGLNLGSVFGGGNILGLALNVASMAFPQLKMATALLGMFSQAATQGIQAGLSQATQQLGLPKFIADMVSKELQKVLGGAAQGAGEQDAAGKSFIEQLAQGIAKSLGDELEKSGASAGTGKKGWLRAMAEALGNIANKAAKELEQMGQGITKDDPKKLTEYQAATQEFSLLMNTFTNAIKTIGEGNANATRKG
jgi:Type III secretion needle MxiH, YscF, SsaG, EprI, PscF, EscF